jgi:LEA14-like dessication related protein
MKVETRTRREPAAAADTRRLSASLLVVACAAIAVGCVSTEGLLPPDVTLVDVDLVDATLFESTLDVAVRISNDNPEPLVLDGAVIKLELDGRRFGKGSTSERLEIPRLDSVVQRLEMHLSHMAVATKIRGVIESKTVNYAITGKVYVLTPTGTVKRLPIDKQGMIDLRGKGPLELPEDPPPATDAIER